MRTYKAIWTRSPKIIEVQAETSYAAQVAAARLFKAKKSYEVSVYLCDAPLSTCSLPGA